jgi:hypothetical protein
MAGRHDFRPWAAASVPETLGAAEPAARGRRTEGVVMPDPTLTSGAAAKAPASKTTTVLLARGIEDFTSGGGEITLYEGDVSAFGAVRLAVTAFVQDGGLMIKVLDVEDAARPIVLQESIAETSYQEMRTTLEIPGRRMALRIWVDDHPGQAIQATWGVWGRPD